MIRAGAAYLAPDAALLVLTLGLLLIYVELNRPGWIAPGALGLLLSLFAVASLLRFELSSAAVVLLATSVALLLLNILQPTQVLLSAAATLGLVLGFAWLVAGPAPHRIHMVTAVGCGLVLGVGTSWLTRIARRARANKAVD